MHEYPLMIQEIHLDFYGHVNNATYLTLYEQARWDFITKRGYGLKRIQELAIGPVILEAQVAYKKELSVREDIIIRTWFKGMKNRLVMELEQDMVKKNGDIASTLLLTIGLFDLKARKLLVPTPEWMQVLQS